MRVNLACAVLVACSSLFGDSPTVFVGDRYAHRIAAISADTSGNTYVTGGRLFRSAPVVSTPLGETTPEVFVAKLDVMNRLLWVQYFSGKGQESGTAVAADAEGNVYVAGSTTSLNYPLRDPFQDTPGGGFVMKLAPDGSRVLWSSYFGPVGTKISSMSLAPDGTLVLGGHKETGFVFPAFVAKLDPSGSGIVWQREFGGSQLA
jgi:outer membrane protein assembly factor BamB